MVSVRLAAAVCAVGVLESVTLNVSEVEPGSVGTPLIKPVDEVSVKGLGNAPEVVDHVYGGVPPIAVSACEYDAPTWPYGNDVDVICNGPPALLI